MTNPDEMNRLAMENNYCGPELDAPLAAMRPSSQMKLSEMLNPIKVIPTDSDLPRDWRGLAELSGVSSETIAFLESKADPIKELTINWCKSQDAGCRNFSELKAFLAVIDRFDVVDDITPLLISDAICYKEKAQNQRVQSSEVSFLDAAIDRNILTIEDSKRMHQGLTLTRYDAFVLHSEEDSEFANEVVDKLQSEYGLKLCVKEDLLPGVMFEHEIIGRIIAERCNRFLVLFSPSFLECSANQFLVSFAQASALESQIRKIVPCVYKKCELPPSVRYLFPIVYNRSGKMWNFWEKLSHSLHATPTSTEPTKMIKSSSASSSSILVDSKSSLANDNMLVDIDMKWDADKLDLMDKDSGISNASTHSSKYSDAETLSIASNTHLISSSDAKRGKGSKWFKKILTPIKKKKSKDKSDRKEQAVAE